MKRLVLKVPKDISKDVLADLEVCFTDSKWTMNLIVALSLGFLSVGHMLLTLYLMRRAGLIEVGNTCIDEDDDDY